MNESHPKNRSAKSSDFRKVYHRLLQFGKHETPKLDLLYNVMEALQANTEYDEVQLWLMEGEKCWRLYYNKYDESSIQHDSVECVAEQSGELSPKSFQPSELETLCLTFLGSKGLADERLSTKSGSLLLTDAQQPFTLTFNLESYSESKTFNLPNEIKSLAIVPLKVGERKSGMFLLVNYNDNPLLEYDVEFIEDAADMIGMVIAHHISQSALRERVKELTCLYGISQLARRPDLSQEAIMQGIVDLIPPGWQYPDTTEGRMVLDGQEYITKGFIETSWTISADIIINMEKRGFVQVMYTSPKPDLDEGPFLREERKLLNAIARQVAIITERLQAGKEKARLQEQLLHADRLATIGQLAAGVAHELNEPLSNILGFAQLVLKSGEISQQVSNDIEKIVESSLLARDIIKKLLIFARQTPPQKIRVQMNRIVDAGISFFKNRFRKLGIESELHLEAELPELTADPGQINQVLINLIVNAIQAMPNGGKLTISTMFKDNSVYLIVEDTGVGMSVQVQKKIFLPFFTTKDVNEGTGLGLAVVHGIITAHKGEISLISREGEGTKFIVQLPVDTDEQTEVS